MSYAVRRTIHLAPDGDRLLISSEFNDRIRLTIRSFDGAVWDRDNRVWVVPATQAAQLLPALEPFDFSVADDVVALAKDAPQAQADPTLTVRDLNLRVRRVLAGAFDQPIWVKGELYGFDRNGRRSNWFFELTEKASNDDQIVARLSAVVFARARPAIMRRLAQAGDNVTLRDGLAVRMRGRLEYYPPSGRLQLVVDDIDPEFVLGELAVRRREILATLEREGSLARNTGLAWPRLPLRVGLITAAASDALHDFVETLSNSPFGFHVEHVSATVQGPALEREVGRALAALESRALDIVAIVRGGGSKSDLAWFDNLALARTVAAYPVKVLIGIGHERDRCVLDEVALSAKTPTAAAELLVARAQAEAELVNSLSRRLIALAERRLNAGKAALERRELQLSRVANRSLALAGERLEGRLAAGLRTAAGARLRVAAGRLEWVQTRLRPDVLVRGLARRAERLSGVERRVRRAAEVGLGSWDQRLATLSARVSSADPRQVLARGYAIVYRDGHLVRHHEDAPEGAVVDIRLQDGALRAEILPTASGINDE